MKPIAPNTLIQNRYLVVQLIGKGGMGEVYLAVDQRLGSAVALKRTFYSDDEQLRYAFEREARTLARLRHPTLPKVSDHFTEGTTQYLVMEHISGEDISKRLELSQKPFPLSWVLFWADHLLDALTYLHNYEPPIIHRDIKPQNLKLTNENNIILLDFGLSKSSFGETRATTSGSIVGYTPHYAPMEQIRGTGTDPRSDIYALSATLYQILSNVVPSDALTRADAIISGFEDPIKPLNEINPEVPKSISDIIYKGMSVSQDKRFTSAREMQKALREAFSKSKTETFSQAKPAKQPAQPEVKPSQIVTEVITTPPPVSAVQMPSQYLSETDNQGLNQPHSSVAEDEKPKPDFEATLPLDVVNGDSDSNQSAIKTEVLIAGSTPEITAAQNGEFDKANNFADKAARENDYKSTDFAADEKFDVSNEDFSKTNDFAADEKFSETSDFSSVESYSPDSSVPLFTSDNRKNLKSSDVETNFEADSSAITGSAPAYDFVSQTDHSTSADAVKTPLPVQKSAAPKKSNGKMFMIAGGLGALLILAIGAVAFAKFMFGGDSTVKQDIPAPIPQATVEITPTPAPTLEAVTNTNSEEVIGTNTNANSSVEKELANTNTTDKSPDTDTTDSTSARNGKTKKTEITQPTPVTISTPKPSKQITTVKKPSPAKTPVSAKTPAKVNRTVVIP
ncbi:MAG: protein kinase [Acidobacteriota bacterium]